MQPDRRTPDGQLIGTMLDGEGLVAGLRAEAQIEMMVGFMLAESLGD